MEYFLRAPNLTGIYAIQHFKIDELQTFRFNAVLSINKTIRAVSFCNHQ